MEKLEWKETFNRQPVHYIFFDFSVRMPIDSIKIICQILQNVTALSNSLKGPSRFTMLGIFSLCERAKCIYPLQSIKYNYTKMQISLESMQASRMVPTEEKPFEAKVSTEILQDAVKQYENYFQNAVLNAEEWPQIQMLFFTAQTSQNFVKMLQQALPSIHLAYINKVQAVILRSCVSSSASSSGSKPDSDAGTSSPVLFENDETDDIVSSLIHVTEMDANPYQIESLFKQWMHDSSTESDHLRLNLGRTTLRCDVRECTLSADSLPVVGGHFYLLSDGYHQHPVRPNSASSNNKMSATSSPKVPVYSMDAVAVVRKEGICQSLLFGHSYTATATQCWKIEWDELDRNQQLFLAVTRHLCDKGLVLLARKKTAQIRTSEKVLPAGFFALFPAKDRLLVKSVAPRELVLPAEELPDKEIPFEVMMEAKECLDNLELKATYNPLMMTSGLYPYLLSSQTKRMRSTTSFVTPILARDEDRAAGRKKKKMPDLETSSTKGTDISFLTDGDFMSASTLLKRKFTQEFD